MKSIMLLCVLASLLFGSCAYQRRETEVVIPAHDQVVRDEIPAETASFRSTMVSAVREDWMVEVVGHKLKTHHPVIEPVSANRTKANQ